MLAQEDKTARRHFCSKLNNCFDFLAFNYSDKIKSFAGGVGGPPPNPTQPWCFAVHTSSHLHLLILALFYIGVYIIQYLMYFVANMLHFMIQSL